MIITIIIKREFHNASINEIHDLHYTEFVPDSVYPPIPGEIHKYYGNIHFKQVKLPPSSINNSTYRYSRDSENMSIYEATSSGHLARVKEILAPKGSGGKVTDFSRANIANSSSGLTPLHYAASRGHLDVVKWLVESAGAIVDLEDQTGETALLKASYNGHTSVVDYLLQKDANVSQKDNDGWTALHNASAQGHYYIVRYLIEYAKADVDVENNRNITPLMNVASKGHIDIVEYLLNYADANPFIKNSFGETAYDAAATSNEVYICELLEKAERDWWKGGRPIPEPKSFRDLEISLPPINQPYDVFTFHISVPIILHENQRASSVFPMALRGPPKYSAANLLKTDNRVAWSLHPSGQPSSKEDVKLPVGPNSSSISIISNATTTKLQNRQWFWVDEWQIDMSYPHVDEEGWQYAKSFNEPVSEWTAYPPPNANNWVRRRRWARVMKRRMSLSDSGLHFTKESQLYDLNYIEQAEMIIQTYQNNKKGRKDDPYGQANSIMAALIQHAEGLEGLTKNDNGVQIASSRNKLGLEIKNPNSDITNNGMVTPNRAYPKIGLNTTNVPASTLKHPKWENDENVQECRQCQKKFNFWIRKHHCRRCGQVFCDKCSSARVFMSPLQALYDPSVPNDSSASSQYHRVCDSCNESAGHLSRSKFNSFVS
nr:2808_t:CDS:2 [Entrophospora candida]